METKQATDREQLKRYTELTNWIRELSAPQLGITDNAERYRMTLMQNFTRIGELARLNRDVLEEYYYPLLESEDPLSEESVEALRDFSDMLINAYTMESIDVPMMYLQSQKVLQDAEKADEVRTLIRALDDVVVAAFSMMHTTYRLTPCYNVCYKYRDIGLEAANRLLEFLPKETFAALPDDECREIVLINARYISNLFERGDDLNNPVTNREDLEVLKRALDLASDPFYTELMPDYNWTYHIFRTLQYMTNQIGICNIRGFDAMQLEEIYQYTVQFASLWDSEPFLTEYCNKGMVDLALSRAAYLSGHIDVNEYKDALLEISKTRDMTNFSFHSNQINLLVPLEYILVLDREHISKSEEQIVSSFYRRLISYVHHMPKRGSLTFMLTFLADILKNYIEVPGGMDFETMCVELMAALHPQTYVHSLDVADLTVCLTKHLLFRRPELFTDFLDCPKEEVSSHAGEVINYAYQAAYLHDIGKLFIIENILTYGRNLFDQEFDLIRTHPVFGAYILEQYPKTAKYANIARAHHCYYDGSSGYPEDFDIVNCKERVMISIVTCADCMDAATDSIGRSYKEGKTLTRFLEELEEGSGTRYAPYMAELLRIEEVRSEVEMLLDKGRDRNYRNTYHILEAL